MKGEEFMKKVIDGERDFSAIVMNDEDLTKDVEMYVAFNGTLQRQESIGSREVRDELMYHNTHHTPLILNYASLRGVSAPGLRMDRVQAFETQFHGSNLQNAVMNYANLSSAEFGSVDLQCAHIDFSCLNNVKMNYVDLRGARFIGSMIRKIEMRDSNCEEANFLNTIIDGDCMVSSNFRYAKFPGSYLNNLFMSRSDVTGADFGKSILGLKVGEGNRFASNLSEAMNLDQAIMVAQDLDLNPERMREWGRAWGEFMAEDPVIKEVTHGPKNESHGKDYYLIPKPLHGIGGYLRR